MLLFSHDPKACFASDVTLREPIVSLDIVHKPLALVLKEISKNTGYKISFDEAFSDFPVSLSAKKLTIRQCLSRMMKRINHAIIFNAEKKEIFVRIYDKLPNVIKNGKELRVEKSFVELNSISDEKPSTAEENIEDLDSDTIPPDNLKKQKLMSEKAIMELSIEADGIKEESEQLQPEYIDDEGIPPSELQE
jgi:hypothetical protein